MIMITNTNDNPFIQLWLWKMDFLYTYWYIWIPLLIAWMCFAYHIYSKRQKKWDEHMTKRRIKFEEFKRKVNDLNKSKQ